MKRPVIQVAMFFCFSFLHCTSYWVHRGPYTESWVFDWRSFHQGWVRGVVEWLLGCSPKGPGAMTPSGCADTLQTSPAWAAGTAGNLRTRPTHLDTAGHYECVQTVFTRASLSPLTLPPSSTPGSFIPREQSCRVISLSRIMSGDLYLKAAPYTLSMCLQM